MSRGILFTAIGMFLFSFDLRGALTPLGGGAGRALPKAIEMWGSVMGVLVILAFGFLAGMGATFAEPALVALGETVEKLTKGKFRKGKLIFAVAIGVGSGIALGFAKVYFKLHLWKILLVGYSCCL